MKQLSIGIILTTRFTLTALSSFVDVLRLAADAGDQSRQIRCRWNVLSHDMQPVRASCGLLVHPDMRLGDPADFDYIAVVGGLVEKDEYLSDPYCRFLQRAADRNVSLIGLCTGGFALHQASVMEGYKCCVSWFHRMDYMERFDGLDPVTDRIFVVDRDRLTCSGGTSAAHLAAFLVERHIGRRYAKKSLKILIIDDQLDSTKAQPGVTLDFKTHDNLVRRAISIMEQEIDSKFKVADLADQLGISRRALEERFRRELDIAPAQLMSRLRIEKAKHLLQASDMNVSSVAIATGYCDASHFARAFLREVGVSPGVFAQGARRIEAGD